MLIAEKPKQRNRAKTIPKSLIYEVIDGKPLYYEGYKDVLANKKTSEEIMGASGLQSYIIYYLLKVLYAKLDDRKYRFLTNEIGIASFKTPLSKRPIAIRPVNAEKSKEVINI